MAHRVLIVEDDLRLQELLADLLTGAGYKVATESRGDVAVDRILGDAPDLVLLDIGLPGKDGLEVCRSVRSDYAGRILVLTARGDEIDEILGLELGADDYLAKPVAPRRLLARVKALLRRPAAAITAPVENGPLIVDPGRRLVSLDGRTLEVGTAEFELLLLLARRLGEVVSRDDILRSLRGGGYDGIDRSVDLRVSRLRKVLGDDPRKPTWIKTVHGAGYLLARA